MNYFKPKFLVPFAFFAIFGFVSACDMREHNPTPEQSAKWAETREDCYTGKMYYNKYGMTRTAKPGSNCKG